MPNHVFKPNIAQSLFGKQGNAHCILVAGYIFPLSLGIPPTLISLQVLYSAIQRNFSVRLYMQQLRSHGFFAYR